MTGLCIWLVTDSVLRQTGAYFVCGVQVPPGGTASLLVFLAASEAPQQEEGRGGRLDSLLQLHFTHSPWQPPPAAVQEVLNEWTPSLLGRSPAPPPSVTM